MDPADRSAGDGYRDPPMSTFPPAELRGPPTELAGPWWAAPADDARRADLLEGPGAGTALGPGWLEANVPGHWRTYPGFETEDGPVLHALDLAAPAPGDGDGDATRSFLVFDGTFYTADVWLDGTYLGDTEGYFFPHTFEVTDQLTGAAEHRLVVEVACAPQRDRAKKRNLTGVFQHWDCIDPSWNPGGIWRPVRLEQTGPVRIKHFRAICTEASETSALVSLRAVVDTADARTITLRTRVADVERRFDHPLAAGENRIEWTVAVADPVRWWPHVLGDPALHDLEVAVLLDDDVESDRRHRRIGFRTVSLDGWVAHVNGERLFLKGVNLGPARADLGAATGEEVAADVGWARDAGLDLVRVHAHISRPELYDAADEQGMLVWQDLPLQWGYARSVRSQARRQAREAVDLLGHHPSVAIWCGHNEPLALDIDAEALADPKRRRSLAVRGAIGMVAPSWNRSVLDLTIRRVLRENDPSRPVVPHSGVWPHLPQLDGTDSHLYFGWYHGHRRDLPRFAAAWPRMVRFVSELGAQAVPRDAAFCEPDRWPDLDWDRLATEHGLQRWVFDRVVPPADHDDFESWAEATRTYQAELVKLQVEALRRLKYRPTGGFIHFFLADNHPAVSWSVLDHTRVPKPGYHALAAACAPVIVVADPPPERMQPGETIDLEVHVVSDARIDLGDMVVTAHLSEVEGDDGVPPDSPPPRDPTGAEAPCTWSWTGDVPADSCTRVGAVALTAPERPGEWALDLQLSGAGLDVRNRYVTTVTPAPATIGA